MLTVRPKAADLHFQVYSRPLHPELFQCHKAHCLRRGPYTVELGITSSGHVLTWSCGGITLTEVTADADHPLPTRRRLLHHPLRGHRSERIDFRDQVRYQTSFQLESLEPELFWAFQDELARDADREGVLCRFDSGGRLALGALSYVHLETRSRQLLVQAYHTFPGDYAVAKTQSLFELLE